MEDDNNKQNENREEVSDAELVKWAMEEMKNLDSKSIEAFLVIPASFLTEDQKDELANKLADMQEIFAVQVLREDDIDLVDEKEFLDHVSVEMKRQELIQNGIKVTTDSPSTDENLWKGNEPDQ